jgi:hypothetical protein
MLNLVFLRTSRQGCDFSSGGRTPATPASNHTLIIILPSSVHGLQLLLVACSVCYDMLSLKLDYDESNCIIFGECCVKAINPKTAQSNVIHCVDSIKYLGISINGGHKLTFDIRLVKRSFYAAFNSIASKSRSLSELTQLNLFESYCLPLSTYALPTVTCSYMN